MRNIKLTLEYDGAAFFGFQRQPRHPTIQEALEKALSRLFNRKMKIAAASGRTDTGVHALGQVVNFKTDSALSLPKIQKALNGILPAGICVKEIAEMPVDFHARYSARSKVYEYRIWNHPVRSPLHAGRAYHVSVPLDLRRMKRAAKILQGRHDFRSFCSSGSGIDEREEGKKKSRGTLRTVHRLRISKRGSLLGIEIEADGFLYHMVRNMVGTLIDVGMGKRAPAQVGAILQAKDRTKAGM